MNAITNKPELDRLIIYRDDKLDRVHEVKRYGTYALELVAYAGKKLAIEIGECALVMESMLDSSINPTP